MSQTQDRLTLILASAATLGALACTDAAAPKAAPAPMAVPAFVYVADANGYATLMRYRDGATAPLTSGSNNYDPNSAASRLVFTSTRDGMPQVYIADLDVTTVRRVTNSGAFDQGASLSPKADSIVFVSTRSGTPKLWVVNAPALDATAFDAPVQLATGAADWVPESAPSWSPLGSTIAFTSTRDGVSQVYVMPSGGGTPQAITNEMGGAFYPSWSPDGSTIYYVAATPQLVLRRVSAQGGQATTVTDPHGDSDLDAGGAMSCGSAVCLFNTSPNNATGDMLALSLSAGSPQVVFTRTAAQEREPAVLVQ